MISTLKYDKHIFICTNQRAEGERVCCGQEHGLLLVAKFKKLINDKKLNIDIRTQRAGCLDICEFGPSLVVYPEGVFYGRVKIDDVEEIVESHIVNNTSVERLRLKFDRK